MDIIVSMVLSMLATEISDLPNPEQYLQQDYINEASHNHLFGEKYFQRFKVTNHYIE